MYPELGTKWILRSVEPTSVGKKIVDLFRFRPIKAALNFHPKRAAVVFGVSRVSQTLKNRYSGMGVLKGDLLGLKYGFG